MWWGEAKRVPALPRVREGNSLPTVLLNWVATTISKIFRNLEWFAPIFRRTCRVLMDDDDDRSGGEEEPGDEAEATQEIMAVIEQVERAQTRSPRLWFETCRNEWLDNKPT
eukprot:c12596_g1_i2.p1 GENE.c12596_g1_i2~~c12596_g1_i2.p1  ORF type:complete len:118 (+),score=28.09 c12596_g1_i2:22-354(+)